MAAVLRVASLRLARRWRALIGIGLLLGLGFGFSLATFAAARQTASSYDRMLELADAPDAAIEHALPPERVASVLGGIEGVTAQRNSVGFVGEIDGVDPARSRALLAPTGDEFPIERPQLSEGRLPDPDAPDEVFVNATVADGAGLEVGRRLVFRLLDPGSPGRVPVEATVVGIGTFPTEVVTDETTVFGVAVFSRAFFEEHRDLMSYSLSYISLAPGVDARRDIAPEAADLGHELQFARQQERTAVNDALRPLLLVLVAFGVIAFLATAVALGQVIQRDRDRSRADDESLTAVGMARSQIFLVQLTMSLTLAMVAAVIALLVMLLTSPYAPVGPLHNFDPAQGWGLDAPVAAGGAVVILLTAGLLTTVISWFRRRSVRPLSTRATWLAAAAQRPAALAGLTLALRSRNGGWRARRSVVASTLAVALLAVLATFVGSAVTLTDSPARYGFDWDLLAVNEYGDQTTPSLRAAFQDDPDVVAATAFTAGTYFVNSRAVPGVAATSLKGDLGPTLLRGRPALADSEVVVGAETLESLGADIGDFVSVQLADTLGESGPPVDMQIVGVAVFPPVRQIGFDPARLGTGVLVTRGAYGPLGGDPRNGPEYTAARLADGVDASTVIDRHPRGIEDGIQVGTSWFTDGQPAELRQLNAALPLLGGAIAVGYVIVLGVIAHALLTRARANRRELAALRAVGATRRQLDEVTAWQGAPLLVAAVVIGVPVGIAIGRRAFIEFARSLAVVDQASALWPTALGLVLATVVAIAVGILAAMLETRRSRGVELLTERR